MEKEQELLNKASGKIQEFLLGAELTAAGVGVLMDIRHPDVIGNKALAIFCKLTHETDDYLLFIDPTGTMMMFGNPARNTRLATTSVPVDHRPFSSRLSRGGKFCAIPALRADLPGRVRLTRHRDTSFRWHPRFGLARASGQRVFAALSGQDAGPDGQRDGRRGRLQGRLARLRICDFARLMSSVKPFLQPVFLGAGRRSTARSVYQKPILRGGMA